MDSHQGLLDRMGITHLKEQAALAWGILSNDPETRRKHRMQHSERGAARSGMGPEEQFKKQEQMFAEKQWLDDMLESDDYPKDIMTSNKLFNHYLEKMANAPGLRRDDR